MNADMPASVGRATFPRRWRRFLGVELPATFRGAALVAEGSSTLFEEYRGLAAARAATAVSASTRFQLSSVSKQFVAACILLLAEQGSLSVDDPVASRLPDSPPSW